MLRKLLLIALIALPLLADVPVSTASQDQTDVSAAGMASRSFVAWTDARAGTGNKNIYGNIIETDGSLAVAAIAICTDLAQQYDVAVSAGQKFMAFWVDERTDETWNIWGQHVNLDATLSGTNFQVTTNNTQKYRPAADRLGNDILVVFEEAATNRKIRGQRLTWGGSSYAPTGAVFDISDGTHVAYNPDVAAGDTDYLVVWSDATNKRIYCRTVSPTGTLGTTRIVADYSGGAYIPGQPAVAWDGTQWLVAWQIYVFGDELNIYASYVDASGVPSGSEISVAVASQNESFPALAFDGIGFMIVFQDTRDVIAKIWSKRITGTTVDHEAAVSSGTSNQNKPAVCWNGTHHDVFWQDFRNTYNWDIYSNRFDQTPWNGPTASPHTPPDMGASSCPRQEAVMNLTAPDGINTSTIQFTANGTSYTIASPQLSYASNRLTFTPSADWPENVWIECCLNAVDDMSGRSLLSPVCWSFMIDRTNPVFGTKSPAAGDSAGAGAVPISIGVTDAGSGVSTNNMAFQIDGTWFVHGTSPAVSWDGARMHFNPAEEGMAFDPFVTVNVCARARDRADYCPPNEATTCWEFHTTGTKIYGTVTLSGESDHSGATVEARYGDSLWTATTNASGDYSIPGVLEVDGITVRAYKAGFSDSTVTVNMGAGGFGLANFTLFPMVTLFYSDFEADNGGLELVSFLYYNDWEWGVPTSGPGNAHSGTKCWATKLNSDYNDSSQSRLRLGPIDLPEGSAPKLSWWQWYRFQPPTWTASQWQWHDGGNVKLWTSMTDSLLIVPDRDYDTTQSQWNQLIPYQRSYAGATSGPYWHRVTADLSAWAGQTVWISWDFGSSSRNVESGWFIDDVTIGYADYMAIDDNVKLPTVAEISVLPNPFNATCAIEAVGDVQLFNITGRLVKTLISPDTSTRTRMTWDGRDESNQELPSGIYFARVKDRPNVTARVILLK
ncbi:MAG TPA: hypothetical protein ENN07_08665 [candidate division Zixibacteria bacterium]|nr:hypothetical protein [candidate division Zixibacteria bacterium]